VEGFLTLVDPSDINLSDGINSGTERALKKAFEPLDPDQPGNKPLLGPDEPSFAIVDRIEGPDFGQIYTYEATADRIFRNQQGDFMHGSIKNQHYELGTKENPELWYVTSSINNLENVHFSGYGAFVVNGMINFNNVHIDQDSEILFYVKNGINCNGNLVSIANNAFTHIVTQGGNIPFGQRVNIQGSAVVMQGDLNFNNKTHFNFKPVATEIASRLWDSGNTSKTIELLEYRESSNVD